MGTDNNFNTIFATVILVFEGCKANKFKEF